MSMPHLARLALPCVLAAAAACGAAHAEPAKFASAKLEVLQATRFVNEPAGTSYLSNLELVFTQRPAPAQVRKDAEVAARVFTLNPGESVPKEWAVFEPCWVYLSNLMKVHVNVNGTIKLGTLTKEWLRATLGGPMASGHYLVVFESGGGDRHDLFRLNRADRDDYFKHGLIIEVRPARSFTRAETDAQASDQDRARVEILAAARINDRKATCYIAHATAAADAGGSAPLYALSDDCDAESLTP